MAKKLKVDDSTLNMFDGISEQVKTSKQKQREPEKPPFKKPVGDYYRLDMKKTEAYYTAWAVVSPDQTEALVSLVVTEVQANPEIPFVRLQGLNPEGRYQLEGTGQSFSGAALMNGGYAVGFGDGELKMEDYPAVQLHFVLIR